MPDFFDIHTIFFTLWDYPMSYLEFFGALVGAMATWLAARANVLELAHCGAASVLLFLLPVLSDSAVPRYVFAGVLFHHQPTGLVALDPPECSGSRPTQRTSHYPVGRSSACAGVTGRAWWQRVCWVRSLRICISGFRSCSVSPALFPIWIRLLRVMSIIGTFMMIHKKLECWWVWLVIDIISTYMYFTKGVKLVGIEYAFFCLIAFQGPGTGRANTGRTQCNKGRFDLSRNISQRFSRLMGLLSKDKTINHEIRAITLAFTAMFLFEVERCCTGCQWAGGCLAVNHLL